MPDASAVRTYTKVRGEFGHCGLGFWVGCHTRNTWAQFLEVPSLLVDSPVINLNMLFLFYGLDAGYVSGGSPLSSSRLASHGSWVRSLVFAGSQIEPACAGPEEREAKEEFLPCRHFSVIPF